ncbi:MAG TPA: hypothetical protein VG603_13310, partial [Chitinophagales bacterium]|nr:hypothetical protein [Chitinophagales bacterium]
VSTMPAPVDIDSLQIASEEPNFINRGDTTFQRFRCYFKDPAGIGNFYQAQAIVNGKLMDSVQNISVLSDKYVDGIEVEMRIRGVSANSGDSVQVNLMCIDAANYDYFTVLRSLSRSNPVSTAVPQNPPTNIQGGAIGYFSARPVRSQTIFVP